MDGIFLWWLNSKNITFFIPAKTSMCVYDDALSLVGTGYKGTRETTHTEGYGKNKIEVTDYWDVEGLQGLTSADF